MAEGAFSQQVTQLMRKLFLRQQLAARELETQRERPTLRPTAPSRLTTSAPIVGSRLQLIGLGRVKATLGERWPKMAERVRNVARSIIDKHLVSGDIYEEQGEDGFLVLFAQLSPGDARFKSEAICREIERRLIGSNLAEVSACAAEIVMLEVDRDPVGLPDWGRGESRDAADAAKRATPMRRRTDFLPQTAVSEANRDSLPVRAHTIAANAASQAAARQGQRTQSQTPPETPTPPATPARVERPRTVQVDAPVRMRRHTDIDWFYRPVWDFQHSTLIMFTLFPGELNAQGQLAGINSLGTEFVADVDLAGISKCVTDLSALSASGRRLPILAQIHHGTIENGRQRAFFVDTVKNIPAECRKLISLEIIGCPAGGLNFGMSGFVSAVRAVGLHMALQVNPQWTDFSGLEQAGIEIVTIDATELKTPEAARMTAFELFADRAADAKLQSAVWGLKTRSLVLAAASAGVRYLSGSAIAEDVPVLTNALRFSSIDLYRPN